MPGLPVVRQEFRRVVVPYPLLLEIGYQQRGSLSPKQNAILMKKIGKYAGQLTKQAIANGLYVKTGNVWVVKK